jgi:hypothetical protein
MPFGPSTPLTAPEHEESFSCSRKSAGPEKPSGLKDCPQYYPEARSSR